MDALAATIAFLLFMSSSSADTGAETQHPKHIPLGSSLCPTTHPTSWPSPSGLFAFGFYRQGNGFAIGIWLVGRHNNTVVWTANRDDPPLTSNAKLQLTIEGKLVLQTQQGQVKLIPNANATASFASMLDSGNFVLYNKNSSVIWQSFDYPTDTMLGDQSLLSGGQLSSSSSKTSQSTGRFRLKMQDDGNIVLYPAYKTDVAIDAYRNTSNGFKFHLYLNRTGFMLVRNDSNLGVINYLYDGSPLASNINNESNIIYRATLDVDGVFRLYVHGSNHARRSLKVIQTMDTAGCSVNDTCGYNSYCSGDPEPQCQCLPGFDFIDPNQRNHGCRRSFSEAKCRGEKDNTTFYHMAFSANLAWNDTPYFHAQMSQKEDCSSSCLVDCYCCAALYQDGVCRKHGPPLISIYVTKMIENASMAFIKVGSNILNNASNHPPPIKRTSIKAIVLIILVISSFTLLFFSAIGISRHLVYRILVLRYKRKLAIGNLGLSEEVALRRFSYNELKRATNGFKQELGKGSFGAVYKGALYKGKCRRLIAVKRLEKLVEEGEREFQAEMRAIGKAHHRNLVRLLGFCAEGPNRLLVYEYMSNGSLGKLLFGDVTRPHWDERVRIALDIAKGIFYLHEECEAPIIHCDIKPHNILMDEFGTAKISDFGLAKLLMPDQTRTFTQARGTRGYVAPEWDKNIPISVKTDVYSYGIVLLEILCCRRNLQVNISKPEETLLYGWAYECFVAGELQKLVHWEAVDKNVLENIVKVALWCIQDEPFLRPTMKSVVLMLEGITDVPIPPCPTSRST